MRIAKFVLALLFIISLAGCIYDDGGHYSDGGGRGGPPPGRGWRK